MGSTLSSLALHSILQCARDYSPKARPQIPLYRVNDVVPLNLSISSPPNGASPTQLTEPGNLQKKPFDPTPYTKLKPSARGAVLAIGLVHRIETCIVHRCGGALEIVPSLCGPMRTNWHVTADGPKTHSFQCQSKNGRKQHAIGE